jgi:hypothetical protein
MLTAGEGPHSPLTRLLAACAQRFVVTGERGGPLPSPSTLWRRWLRAPHRRATWSLRQRAEHSTPVGTAPPPAPPPDLPPPALNLALAELCTLLATETRALTEVQLVQVCQTWEAALKNPATQHKLTERALVLGQGSPDAALRELRTQLAGVVGARLRESGLPIGRLLGEETAGTTALGAAAAHGVRTQLLEELEQACDALHDRTLAKRALPVADEWREWAALRARYQRVGTLGGQAVRHLAWAPLHREACSYAVWLWNERKEKVLGNAVFRFLLREAEQLGDESRLPLARKNVACGI